MKKTMILLALIVALIPGRALARYDQTHTLLDDASGTTIVDYSLTSGAAVYSETINVERNGGFAALLITEDKAGGAGDVDISAEYSVDGTNWYAAYTTSSGSITIDANIVTALQNVTRWIVYSPRPSKYLRYKFDPDANSQITARHIFVEDR